MLKFRHILLLILFLCIIPGLPGQSLDIRWQTSVPAVSAFSSPRVADLNGDGIQDVVVGAGIEGSPSPAGIFAFDGANGSRLWQRYARDQMYGSPIFQDITGDSIPEVFMSGRDAQLYALDGTTGFQVWEFWSDLQGSALDSGWYNFYLPQWIPDQNSDGFQDLLITNGGDPRLGPNIQERPAGYLMVISAADGSILQVDSMPDGQETYHSPLVADLLQNGDLQVFFGSGGETVGGRYWQVALDDFMTDGLTNARALLFDQEEGYIAVPAIADLSQDGIPDLIVPQLNEHIIALEGGTGQELWRHREPGTDCYVSPAIGQFTGDPTPDVFVLASTGNWPFFQESIKLVIDGSTGQVVWSEAGFPFHMANGLALDWDEDGFDEIIYPNHVRDISQGIAYRHQLYLYDFNDQMVVSIDSQRLGTMIFSVPQLTDLEGDHSLEMIFVVSDNSQHWYDPDGFTVYCADLPFFREQIAWGGYLGTAGDGIYPMNLQVGLSYASDPIALKVYPNPVQHRLHIQSTNGEVIRRIVLRDLQGRKLIDQRDQKEIDVSLLPPGVYSYQLWGNTHTSGGRLLKI